MNNGYGSFNYGWLGFGNTPTELFATNEFAAGPTKNGLVTNVKKAASTPETLSVKNISRSIVVLDQVILRRGQLRPDTLRITPGTIAIVPIRYYDIGQIQELRRRGILKFQD